MFARFSLESPFLTERLSLRTFFSQEAGAEFGEDDHGTRDAEEVEDEETEHALQHKPDLKCEFQ